MPKAAKKKSPPGIPLNSRLLWIVLGIAALILVPFLTGNKSIFTLYSLHNENSSLLEEKARLEAENKQLQEEVERLKNDLDHIEKMAREQYNLKRPDEEVYEVVPEGQ